jgi:hypothetical protein
MGFSASTSKIIRPHYSASSLRAARANYNKSKKKRKQNRVINLIYISFKNAASSFRKRLLSPFFACSAFYFS